MPGQADGESTALVVPLTGELLIASGQHQEQVTQGVVVLLDHGERVRLANETNAPVTLLAVFAAAGFVRALSSWPVMTATAASTGTSGLGGDRAAWAEVHRQVVEQAAHAPSVHNAPPWRFASYAEGLDLYAYSARLPGSRQRLGAALGLVGTPQRALRLGYARGSRRHDHLPACRRRRAERPLAGQRR